MKRDGFRYKVKRAGRLSESNIKLVLVIVTVLLALLKMTSCIQLSWLWVVSPLWLPIATLSILAILVLSIVIFVIIGWVIINLLKK